MENDAQLEESNKARARREGPESGKDNERQKGNSLET